MIYVDFRNEIVGKLDERYSFKGWTIKLFLEGDTANDKIDKEFIRQTNIQYFGHEKDVLDDDFIRMEKKCRSGRFFCRLKVRYLYDVLCNKGWEEIFAIADENIRGAEGAQIPVSSMDEYDEVNNKLFARILNYDENEASLKGYVFRRIENLAIVLYFRVSEDENNLTSFKVNQSFVDKWGIDNDLAIDRALENSSILNPPDIYITKAKAGSEKFELFISSFDIDNDVVGKMELLTCTSMKRVNGDVVFFYPGMAEKFYKAFGNEDYFVVFTSSTDFHLHRCSEFDPDELRRNLKLTHQGFPDDILTDVVYRYYGDKKQLLSVRENE